MTFGSLFSGIGGLDLVEVQFTPGWRNGRRGDRLAAGRFLPRGGPWTGGRARPMDSMQVRFLPLATEERP